jgi:carboxypeptidase Taq
MTAYDRLSAQFARIATINEAGDMLGWDAAAIMPAGGAAARADQLAVLAGLSHGLLTDPALAEDLANAASNPPASPWERANLELMRHAHLRATALPADLVEASTRAASGCEKTWRQARVNADFAAVLPEFTEVLRLKREEAAGLGAALNLSPYDALMDGNQRGILAAELEPVFANLSTFLADALPRAEARQARHKAPLTAKGNFPISEQEALCRKLAARAGLDFSEARLDRSTHPFCGGTPRDVRITTRYNETDPSQAIMAVLHETGHAIYERGLPTDYARQPVGFAAGMAMHESQSLILEMQACRSDAFLGWLSNALLAAFPEAGAAFAPANLARSWRRVKRDFIRTEADEMTYPAHVMLRFDLERAMIAGDLSPADLPGAWNEGMQKLLGITPPDDRLGCLQDIHWYDGSFGYFPSYTLGAMAAAQLMAAARRAVPMLDRAFARGDLSPLLEWLRVQVHGQGARLGFNDLLRAATGKPLDPTDFEAHLLERYVEN